MLSSEVSFRALQLRDYISIILFIYTYVFILYTFTFYQDDVRIVKDLREFTELVKFNDTCVINVYIIIETLGILR